MDIGCSINGQIYTIPTDQILSYLTNSPSTNINTFQFTFTISLLNNPISLQPTSPFSISINTVNSTIYYIYAADSTTLTTHNNYTV